MEKIAILVVYYGEFPPYFDLWIRSCEYNQTIDFFIVTDNKFDDLPDNVKIINITLDEFRKFYPKKLSGGLLRRLNIACGIAHKPKLIFFDEPTVAVDPQSRNKILEGIQKLNEEGATIVYTTHYMEEAEQICTRIAIMDKGQQIAIGTKDELKKMIKNTETVSIEIPELQEENLEALGSMEHVYKTEYDEGKLTLNFSGGTHNLIHVLDYLKDKNLVFGRVYSELPTLNDVFLEITGKELRDV